MNALPTIIAAVFGLIIGSFLNVIDLRFGHWKSIVTTRSHCPHCHHSLVWYDLVPVLSFVNLKARCRYCKKPISWQYPLVELASAGFTALVWFILKPHDLSSLQQALGLLIFVYSCLVMILQDMREMSVSDGLFITAIIGAPIFALGHTSFQGLLLGVAGSSLLLFILVFFSRERWMGWGDVILSVPIGIILGFPKSLLWLDMAFTVGALYGALLLIAKLKKRTDPVPFIPIMVASFVITLTWGDKIVSWYTASFWR